MNYPANQRDEVRRRYLTKGPCQPYGHKFKQILISGSTRRFNPAWFDQYEGFSSWNKPDRLLTHMGKPPNSTHIIAAQMCEDLMNQNQSIVHALFKQDDKVKSEYRIRLNASINASRFLLRQGLPFRGHTEKEEAVNKGNFLELVKYTGEQNDAIKQIGVVLRFVDKRGAIKERFIGVVHVKETSSLALKSAIDDLFARYGISIKNVRGQGNDGASNMRESTKRELQKLRDDGWELLMAKVASFCKIHDAEILIMEEDFVDRRRPRKRTNITNMHHYKVNCFCTVLDLQIQESNDRFTEVTIDLLICMASLSPIYSFHGFDKEKLVRLAKFYPDDFSYGELLSLEQL
ncbi:PREDICTED: uncharacterized protein LOC106315028 [Brassica oleracea var. oleracea]|uniref:uncharacterized protein LOC106315028 n=1 Tax=Brassica oleracea var. oleracea TaxID=109376 RepID=UPI0006A710A2|nr:PREDICTED: uncharacterized protein LOC106315028 [Brassica oleracea var. oleracea]